MPVPSASDLSPDDVRMDVQSRRFVLDLDGRGDAFVDYVETADGAVTLGHAEVPVALRGRGYGSTLVEGTLDRCREKGLEVLPFCPYIHAWIRRHPERIEQVSDHYVRKDALRRTG